MNILQKKPCIMGILNITPDSFYDGGKYIQETDIQKRIEEFVKYDVGIIDVGGESTRPGALPVSIETEKERVIPVIKKIKKICNIPISIDTYKPEIAEEALKEGVVIINDITGLENPGMLKLVKKFNAAIIIMHMNGSPQSMQSTPLDSENFSDVVEFLKNRIDKARAAGICNEKIWIDPGIGFGKTQELNIRIIKELEHFTALGQPVVLGVSRKSLIGYILNVQPEDRLLGSVLINMLGIQKGASVVRVHDIKETRQMIKIHQTFSDSILK